MRPVFAPGIRFHVAPAFLDNARRQAKMLKLIPILFGLFSTSSAWAQGAPAAGQGPEAILQALFLPVVLIAVFYLLIWRPQQKRQKEHRAMVTGMQKGDEIITNGGILGRVTDVGESFVTIEVADNVRVKVQRQMIQAVMPKGTYKSA
jgi:preprotein translocase subunit YajC